MQVIIGAGAVGTVLAGLLSAAGRNVCVVCRDNEIGALADADAITIDRVMGRPPLTVRKPLLATSCAVDGAQAFIICVKYPDLDSVLDALPDDLPEGLPIVSTLNGVGAVRKIRERFPRQQAVPSSILFNAQLLEPFHARITTRPRMLVPRAYEAVCDMLDAGQLRVVRARGEAQMWGKLLTGLGHAVAAATGSSFQRLLTEPTLRRIYAALLDEAASVLHRAGIDYDPPLPVPLRTYIAVLRHGGGLGWWLARARTGWSSGSFPSMVSDIEHHRRTEVDVLNGEIVSLAQQHGLEAPYNARVVALIHALERGESKAPMSPAELGTAIALQ